MEIRSGTASAGELKLCYEDMGDVDHPPVLLIMGLGAQLSLWRTDFCERLVNQGLRVIRYDNRDVGLSSRTQPYTSSQPMPRRLLRFYLGRRCESAYTLEDMADDAAALLNQLGLQRAHIVGASMGGMIAQIFAARFPDRTKTLAIIFSSNNRAFLPPPAPRALLTLVQGPPPGSPRDVVVNNVVRVTKLTGSPRFPLSEDRVRADAAENYDRSFDPAGVGRQFSAVLGSGSLRPYNRRIVAPTVVIHGRADKLVRPSCGRAIARAVKDARLVMFDGMGHDLPQELWDQIISELTATFVTAR